MAASIVTRRRGNFQRFPAILLAPGKALPAAWLSDDDQMMGRGSKNKTRFVHKRHVDGLKARGKLKLTQKLLHDMPVEVAALLPPMAVIDLS